MTRTERLHLPVILQRAAELAHGKSLGRSSVSTYDAPGAVLAVVRTPVRSSKVWIKNLTVYVESSTPEKTAAFDADMTRIIADALHAKPLNERSN